MERSNGRARFSRLSGFALVLLGGCATWGNRSAKEQASFCGESSTAYCEDFHTLKGDELPEAWVAGEELRVLEYASQWRWKETGPGSKTLVHEERGVPGVKSLSSTLEGDRSRVVIPFDLANHYTVDVLLLPVARRQPVGSECPSGNDIAIAVGDFRGTWSLEESIEGSAALRGTRGTLEANGTKQDYRSGLVTFRQPWMLSVQRTGTVHKMLIGAPGESFRSQVVARVEGAPGSAITIEAGRCGMSLLGIRVIQK